MITSGDIKIRPMIDTDSDYQLMAKWLSDPKVYKFVYGRPKNLEWVKKKYGPRIKKVENVNACFIEYKNQPIGYMQYSPVAKAKDYGLKSNNNIWSIDIWIGEPDYWDQGIGSQTLDMLTNYIFKNLGAVKIVIDPHIDNPRAIKAYEKAGFKKVKILKAHEMYKDKKVDSWLMEIAPPRHAELDSASRP